VKLAPVDSSRRQVDADARSLVNGVGDDGRQERSVHSRSEDSVVVGDEHEADGRVEGDVDRTGQVGGEDDGVVDAFQVEDVDLLSETVDDVENVADLASTL
jgi:hypothetical protein